jgi:hypothetical protein
MEFSLSQLALKMKSAPSQKNGPARQRTFHSADNYIISLAGEPSRAVSMLLLAAGLAVDTIYKET